MNGSTSISGAPLPVIFPDNLNVGDSWAFEMNAGEYNDGTWTATMTFASGSWRLAQAATLSQGLFYWLFASSDTLSAPVGTLAYSIRVDKAPERYTLQEGLIATVPNLADPSAVIATQTIKQQQLAALDQTLLSLLSQRTEEVTFAGKAYRLWDVSKLWQVRKDLAAEVSAEQDAMSGNKRHQLIIPVFKSGWGNPYPSYPFYPYGP